jgi:hypothetical protein
MLISCHLNYHMVNWSYYYSARFLGTSQCEIVVTPHFSIKLSHYGDVLSLQ